tara:strand:+ start:8349 stop:9215 length:867 start_codon:yes stop_codon:yes gene_type:complete
MNFNRRQNRIAGPGFHINVRYDDQNMARALSSGATTAERLTPGKTRVENYDVKEQELLVCMKSSTMYHDGYTHCFSSANGFPMTPKEVGDLNSPEAVEEHVLDKVQFVGVATTEYKPSKAYSEQGFVAQVGGVATLINEGEDTIKPGDKVALGLNLKIGRKVTRDKGIPRDKIRFCLVKAGTKKSMVQAALTCLKGGGKANPRDVKKAQAEVKKQEAAVKAGRPDASAKLAAAQAILNGYQLCGTQVENIMEFLAKYQSLNERVIGKAASYARPGDRLEVVLQPRNPY